MNEMEKAAITVSPTVVTIDESRLLITPMSSSGLICSEIASTSENSLSLIEKTRRMKLSSDISGSWNDWMICGTSSEENSRIFWKTIGTKSQKTPTTTTQIASSVHKAANERGNRVRRTCSPESRSVSGLPIIAKTADTRT